MVQLKSSLVTIALLLASASASPMVKRSTRTLSSDEIHFYKPFTSYAAAAYCPTEDIKRWNCGSKLSHLYDAVYLILRVTFHFPANCDANSDFTVSATGGDGEYTPQCELARSYRLQSAYINLKGLLDTIPT